MELLGTAYCLCFIIFILIVGCFHFREGNTATTTDSNNLVRRLLNLQASNFIRRISIIWNISTVFVKNSEQQNDEPNINENKL